MSRRLGLAFVILSTCVACAASTSEVPDEPGDLPGDPTTEQDPSTPSAADGGVRDGSATKPDAAKSDAATADGAAPDGALPDAGCIGTACVSELVASDPYGAVFNGPMWNLVVDDTNVYAARSTVHVIGRAPKTGGAFTKYTNLFAKNGSIRDLVERDGNLFYLLHSIDRGYVVKLAKDGSGTSAPIFTSAVASNIDFHNLLVDGNAIWFASGDGGGGTPTIRKIDIATSSITSLCTGGGDLAQTATHLFWHRSDDIYTVPKSGSTSPTVIASPGTVWTWSPVAAGGDDVYVGRDGMFEIMRIGATAPHAASTMNAPVPLMDPSNKREAYVRYLDATHVYVKVLGVAAPGVYRLPRAGGTPELFASEPGLVTLTGDATHIYWSNGKREIRRKAK